MQYHKKVNYVFLGSQESMIRDIFEKKKSPFYHFGFLLNLTRINRNDFAAYLENGFKMLKIQSKDIINDILDFTKCHPYFTQQLSFSTWGIVSENPTTDNPVSQAILAILKIHDMDYERLWGSFNNTDKKLLIGLSESGLSPLSESFYRKYDLGASSTVFSSLKRIMKNGYITKIENKYEIDDPFYKYWITSRRNQ